MAHPALHHFALGQLDTRLRGSAHEPFLEAAAQFERAAEKIVTGDQGGRLHRNARGRRLAAPQHPAVDDVVVQERGGVDQFERDRGIDRIFDLVRRLPPQARYTSRMNSRTQALACAIDQVVADLADQRPPWSRAAGRALSRREQVGAGPGGAGLDDSASRTESSCVCVGELHRLIRILAKEVGGGWTN